LHPPRSCHWALPYGLRIGWQCWLLLLWRRLLQLLRQQSLLLLRRRRLLLLKPLLLLLQLRLLLLSRYTQAASLTEPDLLVISSADTMNRQQLFSERTRLET
jgi:hypothetical protein